MVPTLLRLNLRSSTGAGIVTTLVRLATSAFQLDSSALLMLMLALEAVMRL